MMEIIILNLGSFRLSSLTGGIHLLQGIANHIMLIQRRLQLHYRRTLWKYWAVNSQAHRLRHIWIG